MTIARRRPAANASCRLASATAWYDPQSPRGRPRPAHDRRTQAHPGPQARRQADPRRAPALRLLPLLGTRPARRQARGLAAHDAARRRGRPREAAFFGRPLANEEEIGERLSKKLALPIFSSDAISSSAYATDEILRVLVLAGAAALCISVEVAIAIADPAHGRVVLVPPGLPRVPLGRRRLRRRAREPLADRRAWSRPRRCSSTTS